jgi:hypothetical protein
MEVKTRPILFNGDMIRALSDRGKTQTRRVLKNFWVKEGFPHPYYYKNKSKQAEESVECFDTIAQFIEKHHPYGVVGDRLWVRETWAEYEGGYVYRADEGLDGIGFAPETLKWKPSILMPRVASRITLGIESVRVERLQEITEADAIAEGIKFEDCYSRRYFDYLADDYSFQSPIDSYQSLWDLINGATYPWDSNPWVFVVSFKRLISD